MKKIAFTIIMSIMLFGCKSNPVTKLDNKTEAAMKGTWYISSVSYPGSNLFQVNSFGIADSNCFVGSEWKLVSNNNKGEFYLNKIGCPSFGSSITWYVNREGNMVMKILDGIKAKNVNQGFVLKVANIYENSFQLLDNVNVAGNITEVVYQFERIK